MQSDDYTIIGDPHITPKSLDKAPVLFAEVEALGKTTIWLGDLLDTKEIIRGKCQNIFFNYFKESKLTHIVIVGNHDYFNLECQDHSLRTLSGLSNVIVVDEPQKIDDMWFIPYIHDPEVLRAVLDKIQTDEPTAQVLFCHADTIGFDYGNGHISEAGVTLSDFKKFKRVISGHYHKFQQSKNFTYLGTPFSHSFGEANQEKFIANYNSGSDKITFMPTTFPKHVSIEVDAANSNGADIKVFLDENTNNIPRVVLTGTSEEISKFDLSRFEDQTFKVAHKTTDSNQEQVQIEDGVDTKTQFQKWASETKKMKPETIEMGLSILGALSAK